jgi:hypothetical protein
MGEHNSKRALATQGGWRSEMSHFCRTSAGHHGRKMSRKDGRVDSTRKGSPGVVVTTRGDSYPKTAGSSVLPVRFWNFYCRNISAGYDAGCYSRATSPPYSGAYARWISRAEHSATVASRVFLDRRLCHEAFRSISTSLMCAVADQYGVETFRKFQTPRLWTIPGLPVPGEGSTLPHPDTASPRVG